MEWIGKAFGDDSVLLKHELAYCLGQMQDGCAIPVLSAVLKDTRQEPMVRHEAGEWHSPRLRVLFPPNACTRFPLEAKWPALRAPAGEALGAIGDPSVLDLLKAHCQDPVIEVQGIEKFYTSHFKCQAFLLLAPSPPKKEQ